VLYEMLAGKRAFAGESVSDTLATVLKLDPDWDALPAETPASIRKLVRRCLTKDRKQRLQAIGEARIALENPERDESVAASAPSRSRPGWVVAAMFGVALAALSLIHFREKPPALAAPVRFQIPAPGNSTITFPFLSPDGRKLAFFGAGGRLWVHFLESGESRDLTATNGTPFWSPDSRFIGFPLQNKLKKIEATGGPSQTVSDLPGSWGAGAWNQDDVIVFGAIPGGLFRVPASGGVPVQITAFDPARQERSHYWPFFLPDGRHFVYIRASNDTEKSAIYLGSVDAKPEQQSSKPLVASNWGPEYAPSADPSTGYLLFMREGTLMAQPFDNRRMELKGQAAPVADEVSDSGGGTGGFGAFSASTNDVLVFQRGATPDQQLTWYDREGKVLGTIGEPGDYPGLALSPDGTRLAWSKRSGRASNIWLLDLSRGTSTRFTFGSAKDTDPVWSPDGSRIVFTSDNDLYQKPVSGVKDAEVLLKSSEVKHATSWSRDGRFLLYTMIHPKTKESIWVLPLEGDKKPVPFPITELRASQARFSPDGHWVAYISPQESGRPEVYVRSFSMNSAGTASEASGKWQISNGFAVDPRWSGDGRELYYRSPLDGKVMAVEIATNPVFRHGKPQPVGPLVLQGPYSGAWDSTADGRRFLAPAAKSGPEPFTVVLNWQTGLRK